MVLGERVNEPVRLAPQREQVIYTDHYGNLITGLAVPADTTAALRIDGKELAHARTFGEVAPGELFWYGNSLGLVEVAAREASAGALLGVGNGTPVAWADGR
jgi:hypothetical protein